MIDHPYQSDSIAPFEIITGSLSGNYYVKLEEVGAATLPITMFIQGGETLEIEMPLGSFQMKYAVGDVWYGEEFLFGPETQYYLTEQIFDFTQDSEGVSGWPVELIDQAGGNLETTSVDPENW